jgi:hypothetical protein
VTFGSFLIKKNLISHVRRYCLNVANSIFSPHNVATLGNLIIKSSCHARNLLSKYGDFIFLPYNMATLGHGLKNRNILHIRSMAKFG